MARLNKERQQELEPKRIQTALNELTRIKVHILSHDDTKISFYHKNEMVIFYPYSGWHTGKSIKDGRGLKNLLKQLQEK